MKKEELLKISKPILFNTEMVKAILEGRKTATRRIIKPQPKRPIPLGFVTDSTDKKNIGCFSWGINEFGGICDYAKPPYKPRDILYVKETWKVDSIAKHLLNMLIDFRAIQDGYSNAEISCDFNEKRFDKFKKFYQKNGWQSSLFMPKEAARLFLKVTDVRVEKLQNITEEECYNEGFDWQCPYEHRFWVGSPYYGGYEN